MSRMLAAFVLLAAGLAALADDPPPRNPDKDNKDVDVAKTAEQIIQDAKDAGKRLANKDSGAMTQQIQRNVIKNIDELLRKAKEPPPPGNNGGGGGSSSSENGMGGSSKQQPSGGGSSSSAQRKERREKRNETAKGGAKGGQSEPLPAPSNSGNHMPVGGAAQSPSPNKIDSKMSGLPPRIPDAYKNVWGQLPEKLRQEMDLYFREDFMPRYSDMLRRYYSSIAEQDGKNKR
jgi:hypothetical protein